MLYLTTTPTITLLDETTLGPLGTLSVAGYQISTRYNVSSRNDKNELYGPASKLVPLGFALMKCVKSPFAFSSYGGGATGGHYNTVCDKSFIYETSGSTGTDLYKVDATTQVVLSHIALPSISIGVTTDGVHVFIMRQAAANTQILAYTTGLVLDYSRNFGVGTSCNRGIAITCDQNFLYVMNSALGGSANLVKLDKASLADVVIGPNQGSILPASSVGITTDGTNVYMVADQAPNFSLGKFSNSTCGLISQIITSGYGTQGLGLYSDKWYDMMFLIPQYSQFSGGGGKRRPAWSSFVQNYLNKSHQNIGGLQ